VLATCSRRASARSRRARASMSSFETVATRVVWSSARARAVVLTCPAPVVYLFPNRPVLRFGLPGWPICRTLASALAPAAHGNHWGVMAGPSVCRS